LYPRQETLRTVVRTGRDSGHVSIHITLPNAQSHSASHWEYSPSPSSFGGIQ